MSTSRHVTAVLVPYRDEELLQTVDLDCETLDDSVADVLQTSEVRKTLLLRPSDAAPGLYVHHGPGEPNLRATRLSMACGIFAARLHGNVILSRSAGVDLSIKDVDTACCLGPDLRTTVLAEVRLLANGASPPSADCAIHVPEWVGNATFQTYHDSPVLQRLAAAMKEDKVSDREESSESSSSSSSSDDDSTESDPQSSSGPVKKSSNELPQQEFVTKVPLCLHCRRPASTLCSCCDGAYFCDAPRACRIEGWSHQCICLNWKVYTQHRAELSTFPLGDWHKELVTREFQTSDAPYEQFLARLGITKDQTSAASWWRTEMDGWSGGESDSAKTIDATIRRSYEVGFKPLVDIPPERRVSHEDVARANLTDRNALGFLRLRSWDDYYRLRGITNDSPIALLLTFPITLFYLLVEYGEVPCTVARMLKRPLRVHIVGAEKEINFLDAFKEVAYLLEDFAVELVFIVRQDMLPPSLRSTTGDKGEFAFHLTDNLRIVLVSGTYGDSLDPNFDCGSGSPDMVVAFNAGLYAYESWRSVVNFLDKAKGVVGVFTDYNEFSGTQCASLGGAKSRESTRMNPFRQPRAMPVYSMNLPQFSNGFLYAFNQQELD